MHNLRVGAEPTGDQPHLALTTSHLTEEQPVSSDQKQKEEKENEDAIITSVHDYLLIPKLPWQWRALGLIVIILQCSVLTAMYVNIGSDGECSQDGKNQKVIWGLGIPLCCLYADATLVEDIYRLLVNVLRIPDKTTWYPVVAGAILLNTVNSAMVMGFIMISAQDLKSLISDFIGISVVYQCDELLADVIKLQNPMPDFYKPRNVQGNIVEGGALEAHHKRHQTARAIYALFLGLLIYIVAYGAWYALSKCDNCDEFKTCMASYSYQNNTSSVFHNITASNVSSAIR